MFKKAAAILSTDTTVNSAISAIQTCIVTRGKYFQHAIVCQDLMPFTQTLLAPLSAVSLYLSLSKIH